MKNGLKQIREQHLADFNLLRVDPFTFSKLLSRVKLEEATKDEREILEFRDDLELHRTGDLLFSKKYNLIVEPTSKVESWVRGGGTIKGEYSITTKPFFELV